MYYGLDFDTIIKLVSPVLVAIVGAIAKHIIEGRPRLITYLVVASEHPLAQAPPAPVGPGANAPPAPVAEVPAPVPAPAAAPAGPVRTVVHTHAVVVRNTGKKSAHNVRIGHEIFPPSYKVFPPVGHELEYGDYGLSAEIVLPVLTPSEQVTISYLYFPPLTFNRVNSYVKSDEAMAKTIAMIPTAPWPRAAVWLLWFVLFVGASTIVYWLLRLLPGLLE